MRKNPIIKRFAFHEVIYYRLLDRVFTHALNENIEIVEMSDDEILILQSVPLDEIYFKVLPIEQEQS